MPEIRDRCEQDAFVETIGENDSIRIDAKERGGLHDRVGEVRISRQRLAIKRADRLHNLLRTAARVFVQVETEAGSKIGNSLDDSHWQLAVGNWQLTVEFMVLSFSSSFNGTSVELQALGACEGRDRLRDGLEA